MTMYHATASQSTTGTLSDNRTIQYTVSWWSSCKIIYMWETLTWRKYIYLVIYEHLSMNIPETLLALRGTTIPIYRHLRQKFCPQLWILLDKCTHTILWTSCIHTFCIQEILVSMYSISIRKIFYLADS